jgi:anti-sigma28 factor (negative regulator of flagellin synthesis)
MEARPTAADLALVILAGHRYKSTGRRFAREGNPASASVAVVTAPRQGTGPRMDDKVDTRKEAVERIHDAVARADYRVDAAAVAEAILKRLLEGRTVPHTGCS